MKTRIKVFCCIALSFMVLFSCVGYATLTTGLTINGAANVTPPEGLYIISTQVHGENNGESLEAAHLPYTTTVDSTVKIQSQQSWNQTTYGSVTYKITVVNNTAYQYAYSGISYASSLAGYNGNAYIGNGLTVTVKDGAGGSFVGDTVAAGKQAVFYVTYTITKEELANTELKTLINYKFGVNVDSVGAVALDAALVRFGEILNDTTAGGGYETLVDKIDDKYDGKNSWKANFIGNVVDAHNSDTETINDLFQGKLSLTIDGTVTNVTVLIKREDVDGNAQTGDDYVATVNGSSARGYGCEMTLYMTTDLLQSGSPVVYAAVFTCNRNEDGTYGTWYMVGDKYVGTASIVGYEGSYTTGSFDTGTWRSTPRTTYAVSSDYSYTVSTGQTISTIIQTTDVKANSALQTRVTKANDVLRGVYGEYAGTAIINLQEAFDRAAQCYTVNTDGTVTVNSTTTRAHAIPLIKELEQALTPFENIIQ